MRPLSVVSDLKEAIMMACTDAEAAGLEADQIAEIVREAVGDFEAKADALDNGNF